MDHQNDDLVNVSQYSYKSGKGKEYFLLGRQGNPLRITFGEAHQIIKLHEEGLSVAKIYMAIDWRHNVTQSTVRTFVRNYKKGMFKEALG